MKKIVIATLIAGAVLGQSQGAIAQENAVTGKLGTLGLGVEFTRALSQDWNARFGLNGYSFSRNGTQGSNTYNYKLQWLSGGAMFDYFPSRDTGFRLTVGGLVNGNDIKLTGNAAAGTYQLNGVTTAGVTGLSAKVDFNSVAPYVGIGFGNALAKGSRWNFALDLGAMYQGKPKATLSCTGCTAADAANLAAEQSKLQDSLNNFRWYPVLSVGASYQF